MLEMFNGLNREVNPELCDSMGSIYMFLYHKFIDANVHRKVQDIDDALKVLAIERETWKILVEKVAKLRESGEVDESLGGGQGEHAVGERLSAEG